MKDDFEKILGEQFEYHSENVDDQLVWEGILGKMESEPKRRVIAWWKWTGLVFITILVFVGISYGIKLNNGENQPISDNTKLNNETIAGRYIEEPSNDENLMPNNVKIHESINSIDNTNEKNEIKANSKKITHQPSVTNLNRSLKSTKTIQKSVDGSSETPFTRTIGSDIATSDEFGVISLIETTVLEFKNSEGSRVNLDRSNNLEDNNQISLVNVLDLPFFIQYQESLLSDLPKVNSEKEELKKMEYKLFSSVGVFTSLDFGSAKLSSSTLGSDYTSMISERLSLMEKVGLGFEINILKVKNLSISSGIGIELLTDRFAWKGSFIDYREGTYVESITTFIDGSTREENSEFGTSPWEVTKNINYYDERYLITIPLRIGYEIKKGDHRFGASAGLDFRYQSKHTSKFLDIFGAPTDYNIASKWMSPSPRLSLDYGYYLNPRWSIGAELAVSKMQSNYAIDPLTSSIGHQMIGTRLSLRYDVF